MAYLDIRELASDWRSDLDGITDATDDGEHEAARELREGLAKYVTLCDELGCDGDPDSLEHYGDSYEPTLIAETDFEDYARELAEDIGAISGDERWPLNCIDWEHAARELAYDYTTVTFDGTDYYIRAA